MSNSNQNSANTQAQQTYNLGMGAYQQNYNMLENQLPAAQQTGQQEQGAAENAYEADMSSGIGAFNPTAYNSLNSQINQNIATGGYNNAEQLQQLNTDIGSDVSSGGYNESQVQAMEAGGLGGVNPANNANLTSGYNNLIQTGGLSPQTVQAMQAQAAGAAQSSYATLGANLARQGTAQGISAGGETAEMARQQGQTAAAAVTGANAQIGQLQQQGTEAGLAGLGGLSTAEAGLQQNLMGSQAANIESGVNQEAALAQNQQQGTLASTNTSENLASTAAAQQIQAAGGLSSLYASAPGQATTLVNQILQQQQTTGTIDNQSSQILAELSKNPTLFQQIMGGLGSAGGLLTGLGNIGVDVGDQAGG
jgi:hypothetical protein